MRKIVNTVHEEGRLYEHDLALKTVQNKESANYGKPFIAGTLDLATDDDCLNLVKFHFTYVTEYTAKGNKNSTFTALKNIIDNGKTVIVNGKDEATCLIINSATALNDFYTTNRTTGEEELVSSKKCEGGFVTIVNGPEKFDEDVEKRNLFTTDMLISGTKFVEANDETDTPEHLIVKGAIFNFRNAILPVEFVCYRPDGIRYFESLEASSKNIIFTKVWGPINSRNIVRQKVEESAFGNPQVTTIKRSIKEWVISGASQEDAVYTIADEDGDISPAEINAAMADREKYLADVKKRNEEYQASRNSGSSTANTSAAASSVSAAMGGFNF